MRRRLRFLLNRIGEILWVKPLLMCIVSVGAAFVAKIADVWGVEELVPEIAGESVQSLLQISASSMLVIATFAVGSMISAYASASSSATPRTFPLLVADDISQNALSAFIGAFIFSIVALVAVQNSYYGKAGRFVLFVFTVIVFAIVIVTFVRWVDRVARLGRLGNTVDKVEQATRDALEERRWSPGLGGLPEETPQAGDVNVFSDRVGYVQRVDVSTLQAAAEAGGLRVTVAALPGTFVTATRPLASYSTDAGDVDVDEQALIGAFLIGDGRTFDEDPRFGLVVLSEIASRALSPAVNDPGTAIDVIGTLVRLLSGWAEPVEDGETPEERCDRVVVPTVSVQDMFEDAFTAIARDCAGTVEVGIRLQKAFQALAAHPTLEEVARRHAASALARAEQALTFPEDLAALREAAGSARG